MRCPSSQKGEVVIEVALSFLAFFMAFMGIIEISRLSFALNSANEATRIAARLASVCSMGNNQIIQNKVQYLVDASGLVDTSANPNWLQISYTASGGGACNGDDCAFAKATISNLQFSPLLIPDVNFTLTLNVSSVALRESLSDTVGGNQNPSCT
jgi:hypothetical protein